MVFVMFGHLVLPQYGMIAERSAQDRWADDPGRSKQLQAALDLQKG